MSKILRTAVLLLSAAVAAVSLTACEVPTAALAEKPTKIVTHKEYIPASTHKVQSCAGAVPSVCSEEEVLQEQCWRIDITERYDIIDRKEREKYAKSHKGQTYVDRYPSSRCVFPSEFDKIQVGDKWTEPKVKY